MDPTDPVPALTGPFVSEAARQGVRPPVRLIDMDARAWPVGERGNDTLYLDEFGDLWWGRPNGRFDANVLRPCWPEERRSLAAAIGDHLAAV